MSRFPGQREQLWQHHLAHIHGVRVMGPHPWRAAAIAVLVLGACGPGRASRGHAEGRTELARRTDDRTVMVREVTSLSFATLPRAPQADARVFRLPDGGWGVSSESFFGVIQRFDSTGAPAGTLGRHGPGPGEFRGNLLAASVGDTLWVFSRGNGRLSVYSKDLVLLRSRQLPYRVFSMSPARQGSGLLLSGFFHPAAKTTGWSVARVSMDDRADVFGGHIPDTPDRPMVEMQHAAMTQNGEVWTVAMMGGAIDVLDRHLSVVERLRLPGVPRAEDVRPRVPGRRPRTPPSPRVVGLGAGEQGLLWVPIGVADADWTPDLDDDVDGIRALFDTRVLAIDPATRTVVGETLLDDVCLPAGGSLISCVREGDQVIVIAQLMLVRR